MNDLALVVNLFDAFVDDRLSFDMAHSFGGETLAVTGVVLVRGVLLI